ncbi:hypothetical protein ACFQKF_06035 [Halalkalicoccus sp. GCM10025322]|uniref:hypothetical protein n=2 Tax=Halococcaceae TaxID=1963270 RepID=UPI002F9648E2
MKSAEDTTQTARSSQEDVDLRISRRDVLLTGTAGVGLIASSGVSSATSHETSSEPEDPLNTDLQTILVTGLEIDGPLEDCVVEYRNEQKETDESGTVDFQISENSAEVALEKEGWHNKTETLEVDDPDQEIHVPMHVVDTLGP